MAYSEANGIVASGASDNIVKLWDVNSGRVLHTFTELSSTVSELHFSKDGNQLFATCYDQSVHQWIKSDTWRHTLLFSVNLDSLSVQGWGMLRVFPWVSQLYKNPVHHIAGDSLLVYGNQTGDLHGVKVFDLRTNTIRTELPHYVVYSIDVAPERNIMACGGTFGDSISIWSLPGFHKLRTISAGLNSYARKIKEVNKTVFDSRLIVRFVSIRDSLHLLAATDCDKFLKIWNLDSEAEPKAIRLHLPNLRNFYVCKDGKWLYVLSDGGLELCDLQTLKVKKAASFGSSLGRGKALSVLANKNMLALALGNAICYQTADSLQQLQLTYFRGRVSTPNVSINNNAKLLCTGMRDFKWSLCAWDLKTLSLEAAQSLDVFQYRILHQFVSSMDVPGVVYNYADTLFMAKMAQVDEAVIIKSDFPKTGRTQISRDNTMLTGIQGDSIVFLWELESAKKRDSIQGRFAPDIGFNENVAISADNTRVAVQCADSTVLLRHDSQTERLLRSPKVDGKIVGLSFVDKKVIIKTHEDSTNTGAATYEWTPGSDSARYLADYAMNFTLSPDGKTILIRDDGFFLWSYDQLTNPGSSTPLATKITKEYNLLSSARHWQFSPNSRFLALAPGNIVDIHLWDIEKAKQAPISNIDPQFRVDSGASVTVLRGHEDEVNSFTFSPDSKTLASAGADGLIKLWDVDSGKEKATLIWIDSLNYIITTPDDYYMASKGEGLNAIAFRVGNRAYSVEQFDLKYHRPDKVLASLGYAGPEEIHWHEQAYKYRLLRMGIREEDLHDSIRIPTLTLESRETKPYTLGKDISLSIAARSDSADLRRLNIWVNDVPVSSAQGVELDASGLSKWNGTQSLRLSEGSNRIQVSVMTRGGIESLREELLIDSKEEVKPKTLYVYAIGISKYANFKDLYLADKDARDIAAFFAEVAPNAYDTIVVDTLINAAATRAGIRGLRSRLMQTTVDDGVHLFFAGHGVVDSAHWYFCNYDIRVDSSGVRNGLEFREIEELIDGIPARRRVMFFDACHSGELPLKLDSTEFNLDAVEALPPASDSLGRNRGSKPALPPDYKTARLDIFQEQLFADLRKGTGAIIISAARGEQLAFELDEWGNGAFTKALLEGLRERRNYAARKNEKSWYRVSQLRDWVLIRVPQLTKDRQTPTMRRESLRYDHPLF